MKDRISLLIPPANMNRLWDQRPDSESRTFLQWLMQVSIWVSMVKWPVSLADFARAIRECGGDPAQHGIRE